MAGHGGVSARLPEAEKALEAVLQPLHRLDLTADDLSVGRFLPTYLPTYVGMNGMGLFHHADTLHCTKPGHRTAAGSSLPLLSTTHISYFSYPPCRSATPAPSRFACTSGTGVPPPAPRWWHVDRSAPIVHCICHCAAGDVQPGALGQHQKASQTRVPGRGLRSTPSYAIDGCRSCVPRSLLLFLQLA